jgi:prepilin-type N-terminal cleavage/methylation domain-containing protein
MARPTNRPNGVTLIEVMVSMSVLLVGLLGMMRLQVLGLSSNQGARANMTAAQLAREVANGLQQLAFQDARLAVTGAFGPLLQTDGTVLAGHAAVAETLPGVRPDAALESDSAGPVYQRRWTVSAQGRAEGTRVFAVSVIYRERGNPTPREVVVYGTRVNSAGLGSNIAAYN